MGILFLPRSGCGTDIFKKIEFTVKSFHLHEFCFRYGTLVPAAFGTIVVVVEEFVTKICPSLSKFHDKPAEWLSERVILGQ